MCEVHDNTPTPDRFEQLDVDVSFHEYTRLHDAVTTSEVASLSQIVKNVRGETENSDSDSDDEEQEPLPVPAVKEARLAADTIRRFLEAKSSVVEDLDGLTIVDKAIARCARSERRQTTLVDFFKHA